MNLGEPDAAVWVLEDLHGPAGNPALGIVERLGVPFRHVPLSWNRLASLGAAPARALAAEQRDGATPSWRAAERAAGSAELGARPSGPAPGPTLLVSSGNRSAAAALWLKARLGCPVVQVLRPQVPLKLLGPLFDRLVIPQHDLPPRMPNLLPVLGLPHRVSPLALAQARAAWGERLEHLPRPRVVLLVGGAARAPELAPGLAHGLGLRVARMAQAQGGCVLAVTTPRTGAEAEDALSAGLGRAMHVLFRAGDPGPNPYLGFLATADTVVVTAGSITLMSEACATAAPVFIALPGLAAARQRHFADGLYHAGEARALGDSLAGWTRHGLDEAGRIAAEIARCFVLE